MISISDSNLGLWYGWAGYSPEGIRTTRSSTSCFRMRPVGLSPDVAELDLFRFVRALIWYFEDGVVLQLAST